MKLVPRRVLKSRIRERIRQFPVTLLLGPRQCGKTTLAREIHAESGGNYFDLEDPATPLKKETARLVLSDLKGLVVIDEFQRQPELLSLLRVLSDRRPLPARFLVLGSASPELVKGVSETLAGRIAYVEMSGFSLVEIPASRRDMLWTRGGFPGSFLARGSKDSVEWRENFLRSFLERDIPQLGIRVPATALRRFWQMVAHYHGQVWNAADFARAMSVKEDTARRYLDILSGAFVVRVLPPWFENLGKRLVKSPKIYIRDSGILHHLLGIHSKMQIFSHPKLGFSWEGFIVEQILTLMGTERDAYYFKTHAGSELDLLLFQGGKRYGFEVKYADLPRLEKSMKIVFGDLKLEKLSVIYPGDQRFPLAQGIEAVPITDLPVMLKKMKLMHDS